MKRIIECVPNFSEGRNTKTVQRLVEEIAAVETACVLDTHIDPDHNRSVITFVATPEKVVDAAFRVTAKAADLIDMHTHQGEHPRLGATDVLPFVPIAGVSLQECATLAHEAGRRIGEELRIPVYFYESAALRPDRVNLEDVRRGALELLREEITTTPNRAPDVGPRRVHETAGAIAVGARQLLIAFNVNLCTDDLRIAREIARVVRARNGGLPFVKALGFTLATRGIVQVSMNLLNYKASGMKEAYDAIAVAAERLRVEVAGAEIVGLVPRDAIDPTAAYFSKLENFSENKILEHQLKNCV